MQWQTGLEVLYLSVYLAHYVIHVFQSEMLISPNLPCVQLPHLLYAGMLHCSHVCSIVVQVLCVQ